MAKLNIGTKVTGDPNNPTPDTTLSSTELNQIASVINANADLVNSSFDSTVVASGGTLPAHNTAAWLYVGAGTFNKPEGGTIVTTKPINIVSTNGTSYSLTLELDVDPALVTSVANLQKAFAQAFTVSGNDYYTGADVYTITPPSVPNTTGSYHTGFQFPVGKLDNPTNKLSFLLAKVSATIIGNFECRVFVGIPSGTAKYTKRFASSIGAGITSFSQDVIFDTLITDVNTDLYVQILADNPFAVKYLSPAVKFTAANGYPVPRYSDVNDLSGTTFAGAYGVNIDFYVKFNQLLPKLNAQPQLTEIISSTSMIRIADETVINLPILPVNSYLALDNTFVPSANWRAVDWTPAAPGDKLIYSGKTSAAANGLVIANADKSSVLVLVGNSNDLTTKSFTMPDGYTQFAMCATVASGSTYSFQAKKYIIKAGNLPTTAANGDYDSLKKTVPYGWNAVGHSIWFQDGVVYAADGLPDAGNLAKGIQTWVRQHLTFTTYNNYGYSGRSLTWTNSSDTTSILERSGTWVSNKIWSYDSITNDFKLNRPIGTQTDFLNDTGATTYYGALRRLHEIMKAFDPLYICICGTPLQRNNGGYTSWSTNTAGNTMQNYIDALLWVRNYLSWRLVDQFNNSGFTLDNVSAALANPITRDGLHPTNLGYARYYGIWLSEFYKLSY